MIARAVHRAPELPAAPDDDLVRQRDGVPAELLARQEVVARAHRHPLPAALLLRVPHRAQIQGTVTRYHLLLQYTSTLYEYSLTRDVFHVERTFRNFFTQFFISLKAKYFIIAVVQIIQ